MSRGVAILGATGSIGASALNVIEQHPDRFRVVGLSANRNDIALRRLVDRWEPAAAVLVEGDGGRSGRRPARRTQITTAPLSPGGAN